MGKMIMNGVSYGSVGSDVEANPQGTATDTLNTIGIDNVIYEIQGGGGGGGNVDDVYVNGASVLDSSHIAQITSYKEVTKAQYDAIPNKDNDNILYCIIDEGEVIGDNFNPIIYSTSEREVGTWIDGKPIYQKTFVDTVTLPSEGWATTSNVITNCDSLVKSETVRNNVSGQPNGTIITSCESRLNDGVIEIFNSRSLKITITQYTVWYTKTTDVPGAAQYTSFGVPAVHYSTDEQVIGTWIDGSTIYQKTFNGLSQPTNGDQWVTIQGVNVPNIKDLIDCKAWAFGSSNEQIKVALAEYSSVNDDVRVSVFSSGWNRTITKLTIQYTKTTS